MTFSCGFSRKAVLNFLRLCCIVVMCVGALSHELKAAESGSHERAFVRALEMFDNAKGPDDYRTAARELESIVADGVRSGAVFYNLGNAYYRAGEFGRAILNYRKAKAYRPRDAYLEANLQQALAAAPGRIAQPSTPWWKHVLFWSEWFSFPTKVRLTVAGLMLVPVLILSGFLLRRSVLFLVATVGLLASSLLGAEALLQDPANANGGVITGETTARKGTGKDYEPAFDQPLRDGAEFTILSETADWTFGHFEGIGDGWVRNEFVAR